MGGYFISREKEKKIINTGHLCAIAPACANLSGERRRKVFVRVILPQEGGRKEKEKKKGRVTRPGHAHRTLAAFGQMTQVFRRRTSPVLRHPIQRKKRGGGGGSALL